MSEGPDWEHGSEQDVRAAVGVLMVHTGLASLGRGAELAGLSVQEFMQVLDWYDADWATGPESVEGQGPIPDRKGRPAKNTSRIQTLENDLANITVIVSALHKEDDLDGVEFDALTVFRGAAGLLDMELKEEADDDG